MAYMDPANALLDQESDTYVPLSDANVNALGRVLAAVADILMYRRHWLSVAQFLIVGSLAISYLVSNLARSVRERTLALESVMSTPFALLYRHLSRPPQVWAGQ